MIQAVLNNPSPCNPAGVENSNRGKLVAVASGKGGVGKTCLSIALAHALGKAGRKTLLFDGDLGLANVDIQLGVNPDHDLGDVLAGRMDLASATIRCDAGDFDIIAGRSGSGNLASLSEAGLAQLGRELLSLAAHYDHVVLDLGAGIEQTVRAMARQCGLCLVVTTDEPTAITDAYAFLKLSYLGNPAAAMGVIVNMADSHFAGERTFATLKKACESFLKKTPQLYGVVRRDSSVRDTIRHQVPLLQRHPNCQAAEDIESLAKRVAQFGGQGQQ